MSIVFFEYPGAVAVSEGLPGFLLHITGDKGANCGQHNKREPGAIVPDNVRSLPSDSSGQHGHGKISLSYDRKEKHKDDMGNAQGYQHLATFFVQMFNPALRVIPCQITACTDYSRQND
jgi:hypothetical protein